MNKLNDPQMIGMDPMAKQPGNVVYNNQGTLAKAGQIFGTPEMMQNSVAYVQPQIDQLTGMPIVDPNQQQIL